MNAETQTLLNAVKNGLPAARQESLAMFQQATTTLDSLRTAGRSLQRKLDDSNLVETSPAITVFSGELSSSFRTIIRLTDEVEDKLRQINSLMGQIERLDARVRNAASSEGYNV